MTEQGKTQDLLGLAKLLNAAVIPCHFQPTAT